MKTILLRVCAWLVLAASASAVIFGTDAFDYPDGPIAGQTGGVFWDRPNAAFFTPTGIPSNWDNISGAPAVLLGRLVTNDSPAKREYSGASEADGAVSEPGTALHRASGVARPAFWDTSFDSPASVRGPMPCASELPSAVFSSAVFRPETHRSPRYRICALIAAL